ncbi:PSD1 and planctomycete cytochrome C domain-containing protein [Alienimonas californiensis]|uniref:Planctomycete cytochrome C n=1 Tax=Alienimonas californiensis TaxID=2527989 RepID=A0A517P7G7_9PLAN|nr:PSD1 and planctomycete cytochrome C domain-containing protein [Alienimonas californiensis]QDT15318.1 Planctomycete cytochrome C [Alienimonas californiensis]
MSRFVTLSVCLLLAEPAASLRAAEEDRAAPPPESNFARDVQPLLARKCLACHGPDDAEGGLMLGSRETALAVTDSGEPAILPGDAHGSELLRRITSDSEWDQMPPEGDRLTEEEVEILRAWIDGGANWEAHWAFEPPDAVDPPAVEASGPAFVRNPIDQFVQARLEDAGLEPNPPADPATLFRRLSFDLTGLPPAPEETAAFVADYGAGDHPRAYEQAVDRLLASPRYGEKWGRHWLDLVRYAETNSFERDGDKPNAWKYRDYVIRSFNDDKPYDRFVLEQLAGDELPADSPYQRAENLTATGFYRLGIWDDEPADPEQAIYDELDDTVRTVAEGVLGLTVGCARCHDHKLDPIPQADYYKMVAVFRDLTPFDTRGRNSGNNQADVTPPEVAEAHRALDVEQARWESKQREIEQRGIAQMSGPDQRATEGDERERRRVLRRELHKHLSEQEMADYRETQEHLEGVKARREALPPRETTLAVAKTYDPGAIPATFVLARGSAHGPTGDPLEPGVPELFGDDAQFAPAPTADGSAGRRLAFAKWAASPENRLTARVAVNRVWQHHFGRGLVRSSNNFGKLGTPPTHPDLLDWLADRFVAEGWSLKHLHKLIVTSAAYRRGSGPNEAAAAADPLNDLFWRFDPRRLTAEELRDASLAVTGELNLEMYGPGFYPKLSKEVLAGQSQPGLGWGDSSEEQRARRAVYSYIKRSVIDPALADFDFPETDAPCEARFNTVQPAQALALLNGDFTNERAVALAERINRELPRNSPTGSESERIARAVSLTTSRPATDAAVADGQKFLARMRTEFDFSDEKAFELWCLVTLNVNSFLYLD